MENIISTQVLDEVSTFVDISKRDPKAEVECKLLSGKISTKDVADRILKAVQTIAVGAVNEIIPRGRSILTKISPLEDISDN